MTMHGLAYLGVSSADPPDDHGHNHQLPLLLDYSANWVKLLLSFAERNLIVLSIR